MKATNDGSGASASRNPQRPSAGDIDRLIDAHLAEFDRVPFAHRRAIALVAKICGELSGGRIGALLETAKALRDAERRERR
jgi:hypothetical protein